jgi:hypothetical protein
MAVQCHVIVMARGNSFPSTEHAFHWSCRGLENGYLSPLTAESRTSFLSEALRISLSVKRASRASA